MKKEEYLHFKHNLKFFSVYDAQIGNPAIIFKLLHHYIHGEKLRYENEKGEKTCRVDKLMKDTLTEIFDTVEDFDPDNIETNRLTNEIYSQGIKMRIKNKNYRITVAQQSRLISVIYGNTDDSIVEKYDNFYLGKLCPSDVLKESMFFKKTLITEKRKECHNIWRFTG